MSTKSVLCAVDISNPSADKPVLEVALQLAKLYDAQLDVLTVVPDFGMSVVGTYFSETHHAEMMEDAKKQLNDLVKSVVSEEENTKVRHLVATGKTYQEVLRTAQKANTDLIVVGAHQADLSEYLLGPNAARIVRHSKCSVHVVR